MPTTAPAAAKKAAEAWADATARGDYAKVVDSTYPGVVEAFGGRDQAIKLMEAAAQGLSDQMKANGLTRTGMKVGEPGELYTAKGKTFVIIPTIMEGSFPGGKTRNKYFVLGISSDTGETWKFVDGGGLADPKFRERVLPVLPDKLVFPELQKTEITKDR